MDSLEPEGIGAVAVARALAIKFPKPVPDLFTGCGNLEFSALVLLDDQSAEAVDKAGVKERRRTALASIWSRMIRNFE